MQTHKHAASLVSQANTPFGKVRCVPAPAHEARCAHAGHKGTKKQPVFSRVTHPFATHTSQLRLCTRFMYIASLGERAVAQNLALIGRVVHHVQARVGRRTQHSPWQGRLRGQQSCMR